MGLQGSVMTCPSVVASVLSQLGSVRTRLSSVRFQVGARPISSSPTMAPNAVRSNLIPFSSRLFDGRALAQDVWSIFKCVPLSSFSLISSLLSAANLPHDCINLGQGYMNFPPPPWIVEAADQALKQTLPNHYSHPKGRIRLREAIKKFYEPSFKRTLDVETEIIVTSGANEGTVLSSVS